MNRNTGEELIEHCLFGLVAREKFDLYVKGGTAQAYHAASTVAIILDFNLSSWVRSSVVDGGTLTEGQSAQVEEDHDSILSVARSGHL
jgi:hypothetical protein